MLRLLQESEFDRYIGFAYELALDPARSGYPVYYDGMKTKEDFINRTRKSLERPGEDILLFEVDGEAEGVIAFEHQERERYLHAHVFSIRRDTGRSLWTTAGSGGRGSTWTWASRRNMWRPWAGWTNRESPAMSGHGTFCWTWTGISPCPTPPG